MEEIAKLFSHSAPIFASVIGVCFFFAFIFGLYHIRRYTRAETKELEFIKDKIHRMSIQANPAIAQEGENVMEKLLDPTSLRTGLSQSSIIYDRLALIDEMRKSQIKINLSALQQMTLAREATRGGLHWPEFIANLSMMLGLLGTVVGLWIMAGQIQLGLPTDTKAITMDALISSIKGISEVLKGMKIGFVSTMAGLVSAIFLSGINHFLAQAQSNFIDELDRFTVEVLFPKLVPSTEDVSLLESISNQLEKSFSHLQSIVDRNQNVIDKFTGAETGFINIMDAIQKTTRTESSEMIARLIDNMREINKSVLNYQDSLPKLISQIDQTSVKNNQRVDRLINAYEQQRSMFNWPRHLVIAFASMAAMNVVLLVSVIYLVWTRQ